MKTKRSYLAKWLALALAALLLIACGCFVACAPAEDPDDNGNDPGIVTPGGDDDNTPPVDKNENITSVYGTYTHWLGYDYLNTLFTTGITSYATDDSNFFENDTLVLLNSEVSRHEGNAYQWEGGDRYILTRYLQLTTCGLSFWQQYVGHFTWDEGTQNITLGEPELFSYQYFFGDASATVFTDFGASNVYVDTSEEAIATAISPTFMAESTAIPILAPTPETETSCKNIFFSSGETNPKRVTPSSRTCRYVYAAPCPSVTSLAKSAPWQAKTIPKSIWCCKRDGKMPKATSMPNA